MRKFKIAILTYLAFEVGQMVMRATYVRGYDSTPLEKKRLWKLVTAVLVYDIKRSWDAGWKIGTRKQSAKN